MSNTVRKATKVAKAVTASDLFIDLKAEQKQARKQAESVRKYSNQVLGLLQVLAILEDAVRTHKVNGITVTPEYSAVLAELKRVGNRAFRANADVPGLWAEKATIYGNDIAQY